MLCCVDFVAGEHVVSDAFQGIPYLHSLATRSALFTQIQRRTGLLKLGMNWYIKEFEIVSTGMYFYEKGSGFRINWTKGEKRGSPTTKAENKDDEEACKSTHMKFHKAMADMQ